MFKDLGLRSVNVNGATLSDPKEGDTPLVHYFQLCALVITIYDHCLTFDREIEYIWSHRWSKSKALYIMSRYFGDILLISDVYVFLNRNASALVSAIGLKFVGTGSMVIIIITQMIMQLRIKALYGRTVGWLITVTWILEVIAVISLGIASLAAIDVHPVVLPGAAVCNPTYLPRYAFLFWVPVIVFETFLFSLALRIAYRNYLEIGSWEGTALIEMVLKDNFAFFFCAFVIYLSTATTWLTANPKYFTVPGSFSCSLTTIMGCRLILNLCQAYHNPDNPDGTPPLSIWAATTRGIHFLHPGATACSSVTEIEVSRLRRTRWPGPNCSQDLQNSTLPISVPLPADGMAKTNEISSKSMEDPGSYEMHTIVEDGSQLANLAKY